MLRGGVEGEEREKNCVVYHKLVCIRSAGCFTYPAESHSSRAPLPGADKPTVFLDLRPSTQPLEAAANHTSRRGLSALGKMKRE